MLEVETVVAPARPPRAPRARRRAGALPLLLLAPATAVVAAVIGWPLVQLALLSFQEFGRAQVFGQPAEWVWLDNYIAVLGDGVFWAVLWRTVAFAAVCVVSTMLLGIGLALLMQRLPKPFRILMSVGLLLAWAMPALTATIVWGWMFDTDYGVVNGMLRDVLGLADFDRRSWLIDPLGFFTVATIVIVWGAVPFVAFMVFAGLTQVPEEQMEAAALDGAGPVKRFSAIVLPQLAPILVIATILQLIWDLRVFTQIFALQDIGGIRAETSTLGVYIYQTAISGGDFGTGGALAMITMLVIMLIAFPLMRRMLRSES
ncbi:sugar ABC transporter permease [Agrococcus sp. ARC_14]|uniref:carbohydrate ABC transporter permease n=1 Tax=Agrococcus sp. ARC_14 TaxID=2919927 RepID=UPI001F052B47|nr:sugar ABC transporter permease [Agrococcus sp. ARC_14]MCH1884284.1 sugar ABC transporter permease [Agrococcus sp. ARC_14]